MKKIISMTLSMILIITNVIGENYICFAGKGKNQITNPESSDNEQDALQKEEDELDAQIAAALEHLNNLKRIQAIKQLEKEMLEERKNSDSPKEEKVEKIEKVHETKDEPQEIEEIQNREEEQNQLEEEDVEEEAANLDDGLTLEDLVKVDSEFEKYAPYIDTISKEIVDPQYKADESILRNQNPSLEIVSQKLSYVCSKILKTGTAKALKPHSVQLLAVLKLVESVLSPEDGMKGSIGNIRTGEGKSFIIALVSIILQSYNQKIDIVTSNMELATRDWEEQKFYYDLFGITSGFLYDRNKDSAFRNTENDPEIDSNDENQYNVKVLERQIVYSTHVNFQWLYLRNIPFKNTMRDATAIVDEADNILLDGATNPALLANDFKIEN